MMVTGKQARALAAAGNRLKPTVSVAAGALPQTAVQHLRRQFEHAELVKVRFNADNRDEFVQQVEELAARAECALIQRIGRTALFYRARPSDTEEK